MQVELTDRARELVERCLAVGYESPEEAIEAALAELVEVIDVEIEAELAPALEQAVRGEGRDAFEVLAELRAMVREAGTRA